MNRSIAVLMISVLFFNLAVNCFPQDIYPHDQAKVDAEADMSSDAWFLLGALAPVGCLIGYAIGTAIDPKSVKSDYFSYSCWTTPNETQINSACTGLAVGMLMLPVSMAAIPVNPSPERFLGKSPEYVSAYTTVYKQQTQNSRMKMMAAGVAVGSVITTLIGMVIWDDLQQ